jgi:hypothetical protein
MADIDTKVLDELKAKHPGVTLLTLRSASYAVIVRSPSRQAWRKFSELIVDEKRRADAVERLFLDCVVYPDNPAINAMLDVKPALAQQFGAEVVDLARDGEVEKKAL